MEDEHPPTPPQEAPEGYARPNDLGSFASTIYSLARGGSDPPELRLERKDFCDRDVIISIEITEDQMRVLHLKNVREDTLKEAKTTVSGFLDQIEPLGEGNGTGGTVFEMFDRVYADMDDQVVAVMGHVHELSSLLAKIDTSVNMYPKKLAFNSPDNIHQGQSYDPVAKLRSVSDAFYKQVEAIKSKSQEYCDDTHPTRNGFGVTRANCDVHQNLIASMMEHSRKRDLWFHWDESSYEGGSIERRTGSHLTYIASLKENMRDRQHILWEWPERLWYLDEPRYCTMFNLDSPPPLFMENDVRPFASYTYVLAEGGPGPEKLRPDVRDTDMLLLIEAKSQVFHLLHLHHVREETSAAAKAAIENFLDHFKSIDDNKRGRVDYGTSRRTFHMFSVDTDSVHLEILEFTKEEVKKRALRCKWETDSWWRENGGERTTHHQPDYLVRVDAPSPPDIGSHIVLPGSERLLTGFEE
ncbi:unnamed protein product [Clonostachys byssicola]|uniref:Uncharacterized protein n=1 Tax=Clonostachys byssicola TaxID=160290 RepID=A0A9N9URV0_9HYPO|nr:unnamed protein product [Clonostachys byssicola]